jgi:hypothetical protein
MVNPASRQMSTNLVASSTPFVPHALKNSFPPPNVPVPNVRTGTLKPEPPKNLYSIRRIYRFLRGLQACDRLRSQAQALRDIQLNWLTSIAWLRKRRYATAQSGALSLGRRCREILLPLSFRWQPNIATTQMSTSSLRRWCEHFPTPPSPLCKPPVALPIFSRSSAVGSHFIELTD